MDIFDVNLVYVKKKQAENEPKTKSEYISFMWNGNRLYGKMIKHNGPYATCMVPNGKIYERIHKATIIKDYDGKIGIIINHCIIALNRLDIKPWGGFTSDFYVQQDALI